MASYCNRRIIIIIFWASHVNKNHYYYYYYYNYYYNTIKTIVLFMMPGHIVYCCVNSFLNCIILSLYLLYYSRNHIAKASHIGLFKLGSLWVDMTTISTITILYLLIPLTLPATSARLDILFMYVIGIQAHPMHSA